MSPADPKPTTVTFDQDRLKNVVLNASVQAVDELVRGASGDPAVQMGVLMLAQAQAFRRLRHAHKIEGPRRRVILKKAVADFEEKIRKFGYDDPSPENAADHKL
jgi:hypothetical protein